LFRRYYIIYHFLTFLTFLGSSLEGAFSFFPFTTLDFLLLNSYLFSYFLSSIFSPFPFLADTDLAFLLLKSFLESLSLGTFWSSSG